VAEQKQKLRILSAAERGSKAWQMVAPNPGDVIMAMVFCWAILCVLLMSGKGGVLRTVARLIKAPSYREIILNIDATAIMGLIVIGTLVIIALVVFCYSYRKLVFGLLIFGTNFGSASFKPLHDVAFIVKYLSVIFMACYAGMFLLKNFWRMVATPYTRIQLTYFLWVLIICVTVGGRTSDIWYAGTDLVLVIGLAAGWWNYIENRDQLEEFNMILVWVAVPVILITATAPILTESYIEAGRFTGFRSKATGFGTTFSPLVLCVAWKTISEKVIVRKVIYGAITVLGLVLLLWSGTRSGIIGFGIGIFIMMRVFKMKIFIYLIPLAVLALTAQIIGGENREAVTANLERLDLTENTGRLELWASQMEIFIDSPVYGQSPSGRSAFGKSAALLKLAERYGGVQDAFATHNSYLGVTIKFGLVGLILLLALMAKPMLRAKKVVFSDAVPFEEKAIFVLPAALSVMISWEIFFEDNLSAAGRGTVLGTILFSVLFLLDKMGKKYEAEYIKKDASSPLAALAGSGNS
jgi:O-antigen ligase